MKLSNYTKEFGTNLRLAYPVILGMLGHTVVQLIDNIMVGQLGTAELAAVSLGNRFVFVAMSLGIGFSTAITPMIAESFGAKNHNKVRHIFVHGLILCFGLGLIWPCWFYGLNRYCHKWGNPTKWLLCPNPIFFGWPSRFFPWLVFKDFANLPRDCFRPVWPCTQPCWAM